MDLEIQAAKLLNFDQGSRSWIEIPAGDLIDESPPSSQQTLHSVVIATWNIWEDDRFADYRHPYILRELFEKEQGEEGENAHGRPSFDVITLQEVTPEFLAVLLAHTTVQTEWLVTDLAHQLDISPNPYGTVILIRKSLLVRGGYSVAAGFHEFGNTRMQRGLNFVELSSRCTSGDCIGASQRPIVSVHLDFIAKARVTSDWPEIHFTENQTIHPSSALYSTKLISMLFIDANRHGAL